MIYYSRQTAPQPKFDKQCGVVETKETRSDVSFTIVTYRKNNLAWISDFFNKDEMIVQFENKKTVIDYSRVIKEVMREIDKCVGADDVWVKQEKKTYISAEINKAIDDFCQTSNSSINSQQKNNIFKQMQNSATKLGLEMDSKSAQSSIKHTLKRNRYLHKKIAHLLNPVINGDTKENRALITEKKNKLTVMIINKVAAGVVNQHLHISEGSVNDIRNQASVLALQEVLKNDMGSNERQIITDFVME